MILDFSTTSDAIVFTYFSGSEDEARRALEELYNRHSQRIYAYCRRILGDDHMAADMLQETFVRYFEKGKAKAEVINHASYLFKIARNLCYTTRDKASRMVSENQEISISFHDIPYEQRELVELIKLTLDTIPKDLKEAFVLREYNGLNYQEIADIIGESIDVVKVRIFRAKKKIRESLKPYVSELNKY